MTETADKYITPSGRTKDYGKDAATEDLLNVGVFLAWAEVENEMLGGVKAKDAMRSFCRLLDIDPKGLRKAILIDEGEE